MYATFSQPQKMTRLSAYRSEMVVDFETKEDRKNKKHKRNRRQDRENKRNREF